MLDSSCVFGGVCSKVEIPAGFRDRADGEATLAFEPSAWLVKRSIFEKVGPFDESRTLLEDTEWLSRAAGVGVHYVTAPEALLTRRIHASNSSHTIQDERSLLFGVLRESVSRKRLRRVGLVTLPTVSVVIPAFNAERFVSEAIASVQAQSYSPIEVIVVDDGSTDGTVEVARQMGAIVISLPHAGVSRARNHGTDPRPVSG